MQFTVSLAASCIQCVAISEPWNRREKCTAQALIATKSATLLDSIPRHRVPIGEEAVVLSNQSRGKREVRYRRANRDDAIKSSQVCGKEPIVFTRVEYKLRQPLNSIRRAIRKSSLQDACRELVGAQQIGRQSARLGL
jgi:hypothetical protein